MQKESFTGFVSEFGLPEAIRSDNGSPFASRGLGGLTELSIWWLKLGIRLERIQPGKPSQNGRHERMHRTLKQETALPARSSLKAQQNAFDIFRTEYNQERPHEALGDKPPAEVYSNSRRIYTGKTPVIDYPTNIEPYKVSDLGTIRYSVNRVYLSTSLSGELIGLEEISERHRRIHFASSVLGILNAYTGDVQAFKNPMSSREEEK